MNQEVQSDSSYVSSDIHFDLINSKLDKLMQIVTLTEKKPSIQMQNILQLNDNEDQMILNQKQVNLELQNIVNEQNSQLKAYRSSHFQKSIQCEKLLQQQQDLFYNENRKLNETVIYLSNENLKIRKQYNELALNNYKILDFIRGFVQGQQKLTLCEQIEQLGVQLPNPVQEMQEEDKSQEETIEIKLQKKINTLERFLVQLLKTYKNNTEKEELLNVKNQLEQKLVEMAELNQQFQQIKKDNEIYIKQLKKAKLFDDINNKNVKRKGGNNSNNNDNFPLARREANKRQTRGKQTNYYDIIKEFEDEFEDSQMEIDDINLSSSQHSTDQSTQNHKLNTQNNKNIFNSYRKDDSGSQEEDSYDEHKGKNKQNQHQKNRNKRAQRTVTSEDEQSEGDSDDDFIDNSDHERTNRKLVKISQNQEKEKKVNKNKQRDQEEISDFEDSLDEEELSEQDQISDDSESDHGRKKKQQKQNNKTESKQITQKQPKVIPEKKKIVTQVKKKPSKKILKKNQETQDRLFNQLDMILDMQN